VAIVIWYAAGYRADDIAMVGIVVVFIEYINKFFIPVRDLSQKYAVMQGAMAASERIFQLLDTKEWDGADAQATRERGPRATAAPAGDGPVIELDDVHFSYGAEPVLRGVNVRVPRGATVAVVGATGSGKSTVIKLLTRLYERDRGAIRIDGVDIRDLSLDELRRRITVVSQDVVLFAGTLAENILLGKTYPPEQLAHAIRRVGLDRALARRARGGDATPAAEAASATRAAEPAAEAASATRAAEPAAEGQGRGHRAGHARRARRQGRLLRRARADVPPPARTRVTARKSCAALRRSDRRNPRELGMIPHECPPSRANASARLSMPWPTVRWSRTPGPVRCSSTRARARCSASPPTPRPIRRT